MTWYMSKKGSLALFYDIHMKYEIIDIYIKLELWKPAIRGTLKPFYSFLYYKQTKNYVHAPVFWAKIWAHRKPHFFTTKN